MIAKNGLKVAIVGATGAVGKELCSILESRNFPVSELIPFASSRSEGCEIKLGDRAYRCRVLAPGAFAGVDIAFFDASDAISKEWVLHAAEAGAWVIDNSGTFRMDDDIPLVVPEVNGHLLDQRVREQRPDDQEPQKASEQVAASKSRNPRGRIFSGPNCSTVQLVVPLKALHERWGLRRVVVSTYQSASGAGAAAVKELSAQVLGVLGQGAPVPAEAFTHRLAFNCIPHIGSFNDDGYTSEEHKIMDETRKILGIPNLKITATAVRVPTFSCHGETVTVELERPFTIAEVRQTWTEHAGVILQDEPSRNIYPMGFSADDDKVEAATGRDAVYVGRVRRDPSVENGLSFWVVSDNLRKGAALNAIQIGEALIQSKP